MPVGGPEKKITADGVYRNIWLLGVYIAKFTKRPKHVERLGRSLLIFLALLS